MTVVNTIRWTNLFEATEIKIYRDTAPIQRSALPTPIATLTGSPNVYQDTGNALGGNAYWYAIGAVTNDSPTVELVSDNVFVQSAEVPVTGGFANFVPSGSDRYVLTDGDIYTVVTDIPSNPANLFQPSDAFAFEFSDGGVLIIQPVPADLLLASNGDTLITADGFRLVL